MADEPNNKVDQPSEIGKAANRLLQLRAEAEKKAGSETEAKAQAMISDNNEAIRTSIQEMSSEIVEILRPLVAMGAEIRDSLVNIQKSARKTMDQIKLLDETVEGIHSDMSLNLSNIMDSNRQIIEAITSSGSSMEDRFENMATSLDLAVSLLDDLVASTKEQNNRRTDQEEFDQHVAALNNRRRQRGFDEGVVTNRSMDRPSSEPKKGIIGKIGGAIGGITNWFSSFLGIGGAVGGGIMGGALGRMFMGAGAMFVGLVKFGVIGALAAVAATGLMSVIFSTKKKLEAKGVTETSDLMVGIVKELWVGLVEIVRGAVGSTLNLLSRIPKIGGFFAKVEEEVNSMADWLTDFSKTNERELADAQAKIEQSAEEMNKATAALEQTESKLSDLYRLRRRAEAEGNTERLQAITAEISRMEQLRDQQKTEAERASESYKKLADKIAKEKFGGIGKMWNNYVVPAWDKMAGAASDLWTWMGGVWEGITKKWESFTDFWLNLRDDTNTKIDEIKNGLSNFFTKTLPEQFQSIGDGVKSTLGGLSDLIGKKVTELGTFLKDSFLSIFDLNWWKEKLKTLAPSNWFSTPAAPPQGQQAPPQPAPPQLIAPPTLVTPPEVVPPPAAPPVPVEPQQVAKEPFKSLIGLSGNDNAPVAVPRAIDNGLTSPPPQIEMKRDPMKMDSRVGRIDNLMRNIEHRRSEATARMLANVTNISAPNNINVVSTTHNTMAVSPRPISHPTMNLMTKAAGWG